MGELDGRVGAIGAVSEDCEGPVGDQPAGRKETRRGLEDHLLPLAVGEDRTQGSGAVAPRGRLTQQQNRAHLPGHLVVPTSNHHAVIAGFGFDPSLESETGQSADVSDTGIGGGGACSGSRQTHSEIHLSIHLGPDVGQVDGLARQGVETKSIQGPQRRQARLHQVRRLRLAEGAFLVDLADFAIAQRTSPKTNVVELDGAARQIRRTHRTQVEGCRVVALRKSDRLLSHDLTIEINARDPRGPVERQGDMLVVARDEHATQAIGGGEAAILEEQRTGTPWSHQPQGQIRHTGMLGADTHLHIGHRTTVIDLYRSHSAGDVRQCGRGSLDGPSELGGQIAFAVDGDVETQIHARRVVEENEVGARLQRRNVAHGNADDSRPLQGGHPIVDVQIVRVRKSFAADVHFERQVGRDHVGHLDDQSTGIRRHDAEAEIIATRSETDVLENPFIEGRQHLRLDLKLHRSQAAGTAENIVLKEIVPGTGAAETRKVEESGARTVRRLAAAEAKTWNVIIEARDQTRDTSVACSVIADGTPVVDGHAIARVDERPLKVEEVVVEERLGEGDVPGDAGRSGAEIADDTGCIRSTIRNGTAPDGCHEQAVPIGPEDMKGLVTASDHQLELTGLLILGLHTDVIDLAIGRRIGDLDALLKPLQRGPIRRGQRGSLKIGQSWIGGHVEVQVGPEQAIPQTIAGTTRSAGAGQIGRRSDDEFDILTIGQARGRRRLGIEEVGEDEEMPLRGLTRCTTDQRRLRTHTRCRDRDAIGGHDRDGWRLNRTKATRCVGDVFRRGDHVVFASGIGGERHHEILHDVGAILEVLQFTGCDGIHIHPTGHHVDDVLAGQRGLEHHAFHVVHRVIHRIGDTRLHHLDGIGARPAGRVAIAAQIIADEDLTGDRVGDHQIEVVDQLQTGGGIARRIRPDESEVKGSGGGHLVGGELQAHRLAGPSGEFTSKTGQLNNRSVGAGQPDTAVEGPRQAGLAPSRIVHHRAEIGGIQRR